VLEKLLFDRVLIEPRDGAQPPGDGGARPAPSFQIPGKALDVGAADGEQRQGAGAAPGGVLAQVQPVCLAGQAAIAGQEPGERKPCCLLTTAGGGRRLGVQGGPGEGRSSAAAGTGRQS